MNRLEKLKKELAQERRCILTEIREILPIDDIVVDEFYNGFDAASAEYEKIIAELEGALIELEKYINGFSAHDAHHELCCQVPTLAREALQKLEEFKL